MERILILTTFMFYCMILSLTPANSFAQTDLERVSITERSDGKGHVIRFHLSEPVDSFRVTHPEPDLIQFMIFSDQLDPQDFIQPDESSAIRNIEYHNNRSGFGVDIVLNSDQFYKTLTYPDRDSNHLLIALEQSTEDEVRSINSNQDFIYWFDYQLHESSFELSFSDIDDTYLQLRNGQGINVIVIDAGHGGRDPGAMNRQLGIREKDIVLPIALKVGEYINTYMPEVEVVFTRDNDTFIDLKDRGPIASQANGDLFVSIHANSVRNNSTAHGAEVYILGMARTESALASMKRENSAANLGSGGPLQLSEEELLIYELANAGNMAVSERLASKIEDQFRTRAQRRSRGVKQAGFQVLWDLPMPAVLIELGFITNPNEARYMASEYGQSILASAIFRAIRDFKLEHDKSIRTPSTASNE